MVYPEAGVTKAEVAAYYLTVAERLLEHLADRPVSLVRAPEGWRGRDLLFQRRSAARHESGDRAGQDPRGGSRDDLLIVDGVEGLMTAAQFGVLEFMAGARGCRISTGSTASSSISIPTRACPLTRAAAFEVRKLLEAVDLKTFALISGGKGVHVIAPLDGTQDWDQIGDFTGGIAAAWRRPTRRASSPSASKARRKGKIFVDWLRNRWTATAILPWSLRARPQATVAVPVAGRSSRRSPAPTASQSPTPRPAATLAGLLLDQAADLRCRPQAPPPPGAVAAGGSRQGWVWRLAPASVGL